MVEYLLKQWLQTGKREKKFQDAFEEALDGIIRHLRRYTAVSNLTFIGEIQAGPYGPITPKMDHLVCFLPGTVLLYVSDGKRMTKATLDALPQKKREYLNFASEFMRTCYETYRQTASGLAPEIVYFQTEAGSAHDFDVHEHDRHNLQRPETVESLYYFYKLTGNPIYQE